MLPPRIVRRLVFPPLVALIMIGSIVLSPLLLLVALVATPTRPGRRRARRLLWFGLVWLVMECLALVACVALWMASGFGNRLRSDASVDRHYGLVRWFLATLFRRAVKVFRLRVEIEEPEATPEELAARLTRPVIVLSRHAGPGDSFLLVHHLLSLYQRKPRIVMKAALQLDPSLDVVINRLPHAFVRPHPLVPVPRSAAIRPGRVQFGRVGSGRVQIGRRSSGPPAGCGLQPGDRRDQAVGRRAGADRRVGDLSGGRQLHPGSLASWHQPA